MLKYMNFGGHDHSGEYCVHSLRSAGEVRNVLQGYLLAKPFANIEALAALGEAADEDRSVQAKVFMREGKIEGAVLMARAGGMLAPMKEEVLAEALTYMDKQQSTSPLAAIYGQSDLLLAMNGSLTQTVVAEWQKVAERSAEAKAVQDYFLYSEILSPPALPVTPFDALVRRAEASDHLMIVNSTGQIDPKELAGRSVEELGELVKAVGFSSPYLIEGGKVIKSGVYNVAPVSQSGSLLTQVGLDLDEHSKITKGLS